MSEMLMKMNTKKLFQQVKLTTPQFFSLSSTNLLISIFRSRVSKASAGKIDSLIDQRRFLLSRVCVRCLMIRTKRWLIISLLSPETFLFRFMHAFSIVRINALLIMLQHKHNERHQVGVGRRRKSGMSLAIGKVSKINLLNCFLLTKKKRGKTWKKQHNGWNGSGTVTEVIFMAITCV